jgi:hypothetical protein
MVSSSKNGGKKEKDRWDKADVLLKGLLAVAVSGGITFFGICAESSRTERAETRQQAETLIQLMNARESAHSSLRSNMFDTLMQLYFDREDDASQIVALEVIGLNFRDALQIKPLFESLDRRLAVSDPTNSRETLRDAARNIIRDQLGQIELAKDGHVCKAEITKGGRAVSPECGPWLALRLLDVTEDEIRIQANTRDRRLVENIEEGEDFGVSYFDMPMVDYTHVALGGEPLQYSIVLIKPKPESRTAEIALAILPTRSYRANSPYEFSEMVGDFLR